MLIKKFGTFPLWELLSYYMKLLNSKVVGTLGFILHLVISFTELVFCDVESNIQSY